MVTFLYYSSDLDREFEVDVTFTYKKDSSFYTINGIYERGLNIEVDMDELCLTDRVRIKDKCSLAMRDHYFSPDEREPQIRDDRY